MPKKIIFLIICIILALIFATKANSQNSSFFSTRSFFYYTEEWSNDIGLLFTLNSSEKIGKQADFCSEKLIEIKKVSKENINIAIENYLKETEKLKMASKSIGKVSDKTLSENIIRKLFSHKNFLTALLNNDAESKLVINTSLNNLLTSALNVSSEEEVLEYIKIYTFLQNSSIIKISSLNQILTCSPSPSFKNGIISLKIEVIKEAVRNEALTENDKSFLEQEFAEIKSTEFYQNEQQNKELENKDKIEKTIANGKWIDDVIAVSLGEETEALKEFKTRLKDISIDKLDQEIENLQVYEETKTLIRDGKDYIIASFENDEEDIFAEQEKMPFLTASASDIVSELPANAASLYCLRQGYKLKELVDGNKVYRNCIIAKDNVCEEWSFYKGECKIKESK